jgi:hypothetical protein
MKRKTVKRLLYVLGAACALLAVGVWVFLTFFFQQTLNAVFIPKIQAAALAATNGKFECTLGTISYVDGTLMCKTFRLVRVSVDSSEHGIGLEQLTIDSARFDDVSWWGLIWGKDLRLATLTFDAPKLYLANLDSIKASWKQTQDSVRVRRTLAASGAPVISLDSIVLRHISVYLPIRDWQDTATKYRNIDIQLTDVLIDAKHPDPTRFLFSKRIEFNIPRGSYSLQDSAFRIDVQGIHGSLSDSEVTIDSVRYLSEYDEQAFADLHRYIQGQLTFGCAGVRMHGIDVAGMLRDGRVHIAAIEASSWYVDYYGDRRKPHDPHPPDAVLPHTLFRSIRMPILVDSVILSNGTIRHRERAPGSLRSSLLRFSDTRVTASPICTDSTAAEFAAPLRITVSTVLQGEAALKATLVYPIHNRTFDMQIRGHVGPFNLPIFNSYLVTNERKEISAGRCAGGDLSMDVRDGLATTTVSPEYSGLSMKVLANDVHEHRNLFDGLKSLIANTFVLRTENMSTPAKHAYEGVTTYRRSSKEEFFEFIWLALRRSIGKVVGF